MARPAVKARRKPDDSAAHEGAETRAYEKAEKEDKSLHRVVKSAMRKLTKKSGR